jgi:hypothetical protein
MEIIIIMHMIYCIRHIFFINTLLLLLLLLLLSLLLSLLYNISH